MQLKLKPKQVLPVGASITHTQVKYIPESLTQQQSSLVVFNVSVSFLELSPKTVAQAFYQGELEKNFETCKWKTIDSSQTVMLIPAWIKLRKFTVPRFLQSSVQSPEGCK